MNKIKRAFGQQDDEEGIVTENSSLIQISDATSLSWSTRIKCFAFCFIMGVLCSVLGALLLWRNIRIFAALYAVGAIFSLSSTLFLVGPAKQIKNMFKEKRIIATIIMLVSLVLTLCAAFWWKKNLLALIFCIIQYLAMTWYALSYIPFARDAVKKCFASCMG
ncbi:vesicle transport protein SFT2B-like isoform X1 [Clytia hemisphaerica]|uniref:Vesicle transport protein n=1 Tax=Clytia hemisphaerica TaxID=252671 RepID=A0A7M5UZ81_9CNID